MFSGHTIGIVTLFFVLQLLMSPFSEAREPIERGEQTIILELESPKEFGAVIGKGNHLRVLLCQKQEGFTPIKILKQDMPDCSEILTSELDLALAIAEWNLNKATDASKVQNITMTTIGGSYLAWLSLITWSSLRPNERDLKFRRKFEWGDCDWALATVSGRSFFGLGLTILTGGAAAITGYSLNQRVATLTSATNNFLNELKNAQRDGRNLSISLAVKLSAEDFRSIMDRLPQR